MIVQFSKMHGLGNDFIVVNEMQEEVIAERDKEFFAVNNCKRRISIGADGVLFLCKPRSPNADFRMRIFNADGSEAETCVNGLRCVAFENFLMEGKKKKNFNIESGNGIISAKIVAEKKNKATVELHLPAKPIFKGKFHLIVKGKGFEYYSVDVGNPHAVVFLKETVQHFPVEEIGHAFEWHKAFQPHRTNTEFANIVSPKKIKMRVHERGACETAACGSGAIATVVAAINAGVAEANEWVSVEMPGGPLEIKAGEQVFLRGAAQKVFVGAIEW